MATFIEKLEACSDEAAAERLIAETITDIVDHKSNESAPLLPVLNALESVIGKDNSKPNVLESTALSCLPVLMVPASKGDLEAKQIILLIGKYGNPRETVLALEESLHAIISYDADNNEDEEAEASAEHHADRLLITIEAFIPSIPRLPVRKPSPAEIIEPIFQMLDKALEKCALNKRTADLVILSLCRLIDTVFKWSVQVQPVRTADNFLKVESLLEVSLLKAVVPFASSTQFSILREVFERTCPQYTLSRPVRPHEHEHVHGHGHEGHEHTEVETPPRPFPPEVISTWTSIHSLKNIFADASLSPKVSVGALILTLETLNSDEDISIEQLNTIWIPRLDDASASRIVVPALLSSMALDHILAFLVTEVQPKQNRLSPEYQTTLIDALASLASVHSDPSVRHIAFRVLSALIDSLKDDALRLSVLLDLIRDSPFPQMRTAAIGILRSAVLSALASQSQSASIFASPILMQEVSPLLFRLQPPTLFDPFTSSKKRDVDWTRGFVIDFGESTQPAWFAEILNFYYLVRSRDTQNKTGVRSAQHAKETEDTFLDPLRTALMEWQDTDDQAIEVVMNTFLSQLCMAMERVDSEIEATVFV